MSSTNKAQNFPALTGLRVFGAWLVYVHHFPDWGMKLGPFGYRVALEGHVGVTLFFVLSGFLIAWNFRPEVAYGTYLKRRLARVLPLYALVFVLGAWLLATPIDVKEFLLQLTLLRGFAGRLLPPGIAQSWTLTIEVCFYALAPVLFFFARRNAWYRILLWIYGCGLVLAGLLAGLSPYDFLSSIKLLVSYSFVGRAYEFIVGAAVAGYLKRRPLPGPRRFAAYTWTGVGAILLGITILASLEFVATRDWRNTVINNWFLSSAFALLILGIVREPHSWIARALATPVFVLLGRASYAFYLIHLGPVSSWLRRQLDGIPGSSLWTFVLLNGLSIALLFFFEEPARRFIERFDFRRLRFPGRSPRELDAATDSP